MVSTTHTVLLSASDHSFVLKGLCTPSIVEPAVPVSLDGKEVGSFQGLELFERNKAAPDFPQTVADLIANTYFRLTYLQPSGQSGTFGTSVVGSFSFRPKRHGLLLVPTVANANVLTVGHSQLKIAITSRFEDLAEVSSQRIYRAPAKHGLTSMSCDTRFKALEDIELESSCIGSDAFRLFTFSSMFAGRDRYDGNVIRWSDGRLSHEVNLSMDESLNGYLLKRPRTAKELAIVKETGSTGKRLTPGAIDSPTIRAVVTRCSLDVSEVGVQAFLARSDDVNSDSLSAWLEWIKVPSVIPKGTEIEWSCDFAANPPG